MRALAVERQGVDAGDGRDGQNVIEMGEERAAAGRLPFERFAERFRIDSDQQKPLAAKQNDARPFPLPVRRSRNG